MFFKMIFWTSAAQVAAKMERMRDAETKLLQWAKKFGHRLPSEYEIRLIDTYIPQDCVMKRTPSKKALSNLFSFCSSEGTGRTSFSDSDDNSEHHNTNTFQEYDDDDKDDENSTNSKNNIKKNSNNNKNKNNNNDIDNKKDQFLIHGIKVTSKTCSGNNINSTTTPLVLLHGYMNASAYFYRNLVGLSTYFETVYSLDLLGWGLSSRPDFSKVASTSSSSSVELAESFFVESLEAWRAHNDIDTMILAGHSMGGYLSVAYCEKYPHRVERLILLSPVGVPDESSPEQVARKQDFQNGLGWKGKLGTSVFQSLFQYDFTSAGSILRTLPESKGLQMAQGYIERRLPAIKDTVEQSNVADYLYRNNMLPGSGEYCLNRILTPYVMAKNPLVHRIPKLQHIASVHFLYGDMDWMDSSGGLETQLACETLRRQQRRQRRQQSPTNNDDNDNDLQASPPPMIQVHSVHRAGHLLMLDNWEEMNAGIIQAAGGTLPRGTPLPTLLTPNYASAAASSSSVTSTRSNSINNNRTKTNSRSGVAVSPS
jgi:pimeloyl-ACP methyl ester carboxylesterase